MCMYDWLADMAPARTRRALPNIVSDVATTDGYYTNNSYISTSPKVLKHD